MHQVGNAQPEGPPTSRALEDEELASQSAARVLITASAGAGVETIARRIHEASMRASCPFVRMSAGEFPIEARTLTATCSELLDAAAGGTILITDVEDLPPGVQELLIDLLADLETRASSAPVRLMTGTTVSLLGRVADGTFSERLFYRLNIIHLLVGSPAPHVALDDER